MKQTKWNEGWKFWPDKDAFALVWSVPENARDVTLPHDAMIESAAYAESPNGGNTGYRDGGNYTYVKTLHVPERELGKKVILQFDGVYCHALVYVNEQLAGGEANGYSTFYVNLTPFLRAGDNEIRVQVKNAGMTNSRWYSGSGIYRDVYLLTGDSTYLEPGMVRVTTESAEDGLAVLNVQTTVINETLCARTLSLRTLICDGERIYTSPIKSRNLSGRTGRGDTTFSGYINERLTRGIEESLLFCSAPPGAFASTERA